MECIRRTIRDTKGIGLMICSMVRAAKNCKTAQGSTVIMWVAQKMARADMSGPTGHLMQGSGSRTWYMGLAYLFGRTDVRMKVNLLKAWCTVKEFTLGQTEDAIKEATIRTESKGLGPTRGAISDSTLGSGWTENNTERDFILSQDKEAEKDFGKTAQE